MCVPFYKVKCLTSLLSVVGEKGAILTGLLKACFKGMILSTLKRQAYDVSHGGLPLLQHK